MNAIGKVMGDTAFTLALILLPTFVFYSLKHRTWHGYAHYVGIQKSTPEACVIALGAFPLVAVVFLGTSEWLLPKVLGDAARAWAESPNTPGNALRATGSTGVALTIAALLKGAVQTGFLEELLFRGFIGKRLVNRLGFGIGNALQAALFAAMHVALPFAFVPKHALVLGLLFGPMTFVLAWFIGWLNHAKGRDSIAPGWIVHGGANALTYLVAVLK